MSGYIDPWQPVQTAVITHGHGDHLCGGSSRYILARPGEQIARARLTNGKIQISGAIDAADRAAVIARLRA